MIFESDPPTSNHVPFDSDTTIYVTTPGWNPEIELADMVGSETEIIWANPPPDLAFESDPILNGILVWVGTRIST